MVGTNGTARVSFDCINNDGHELTMIRVRIQILLHFFKLSLPGPKPSDAVDVSSAVRLRQHSYLPGRWNRQQKSAKAPPMSTRDALEVYMDKMSTWQLMQGLERTHPDHTLTAKNISGKESSLTGTAKADDDRDWIQIFAEDVVGKQSVILPHTSILML
jgi:hypothetical protein